MRYEDENKPTDEEEDGDEYEGYSVVDDEGKELSVSRVAANKKEQQSWDDGEIPPASPIPENEQTVMLDNADVSHLEVGAPFTLVISDGAASLFDGAQKAGDLKPAFVAKLLQTRQGMYAACELFSNTPPVLVKLKFYSDAKKHTVKIE